MKWQRLALLSLPLLIAAASIRPADSGSADRAPHAGTAPAPDFSLSTLDGKAIRFEKLKGRPVIVDFWATWCGPCRFAMPHLQKMQDRYGKDGLVVIGVSVDDLEPERVQRYVDRLGVKFRIAMANDEMLDSFGPLRALPTTFFINREGDVVRRVVGYIDEETLESYVRELE
jgi:thiol-disulfide isomerase/thioredoxin